MTKIELTSDTPTKHKIMFKTPISFRDKLTAAYEKEKDNLAIVDKYIKDFNEQNNNNIVEYNYEINTDTNFNVILLFKHLFRAIGETQRYAKFNVDLSAKDEVKIKFDSSIDINLKTKTKYDHLPLTNIRASYVIEGDEILNTIEYETLDDVSTYKCYTMLMTMIQDGIMNIVDHIEKTSV
jgi:hypothetical protein